MVTLVVGKEPNQVEFKVQQKLLCDASKFFATACKPERMNPEERVIKLPNDEAKIINIMVHWISCKKILVTPEDILDIDLLEDPVTIEQAMASSYGIFAKLYVLGNRYEMPELQNDAIDAMMTSESPPDHKDYWELPNLPLALVKWCYENTMKENDRLRRLVCRLFSSVDEPEDKLYDFRNDLPGDFWLDLLKQAWYGPKTPLSVFDLWDCEKDALCKEWHIHRPRIELPRLPCKIKKHFIIVKSLAEPTDKLVIVPRPPRHRVCFFASAFSFMLLLGCSEVIFFRCGTDLTNISQY